MSLLSGILPAVELTTTNVVPMAFAYGFGSAWIPVLNAEVFVAAVVAAVALDVDRVGRTRFGLLRADFVDVIPDVIVVTSINTAAMTVRRLPGLAGRGLRVVLGDRGSKRQLAPDPQERSQQHQLSPSSGPASQACTESRLRPSSRHCPASVMPVWN